LYKYEFTVPAAWQGKSINIVFDGSMTDTEVKLNGRSAGAIHQGSFYRFKYDISSLLNYGKPNLLEVTVSKQSANASVNAANEKAIFGYSAGFSGRCSWRFFPKAHIDIMPLTPKPMAS
jgi:beta-galactosidase/beta-glucuronidase